MHSRRKLEVEESELEDLISESEGEWFGSVY